MSHFPSAKRLLKACIDKAIDPVKVAELTALLAICDALLGLETKVDKIFKGIHCSGPPKVKSEIWVISTIG